MDQYSVIVVGDETAPVRRFNVRTSTVRRVLGAVAVATAMLVAAGVDYVIVRVAHAELPGLRVDVCR